MSISTAIGQLESAFGLQLFIRQHAQGLTLTSQGKRFLAAAKALLAQAQSLRGVADELSGEMRGSLSIGCQVTLAPLLLPNLRASFEALHPGVEVHQSVASGGLPGIEGATYRNGYTQPVLSPVRHQHTPIPGVGLDDDYFQRRFDRCACRLTGGERRCAGGAL